LAPDELFEFGDTDMQKGSLIVEVKEHVHAFDGRILPVAEKLRLDVVFAAKFRRAGGAGEELKNDLGFEVSVKRTSWPRHRKTP
jgi:hypothetical protein